MAYRIEGTDIVIDGWEKGINTSPHEGIADMRNVNTISIPGEVAVALKNAAVTAPPVLNAVAYIASASTDRLTIPDASGLYENVAIKLASNTAGNLSNAIVYYVRNIVGNTFQVSVAPLSAIINISSDGTGTLTTYQYGNQRSLSTTGSPVSYFITTTDGITTSYGIYIVDSSNYLWFISPDAGIVAANTLVFMGNIGGAGAVSLSQSAVCSYLGYVMVFYFGGIDIIDIGDFTSNGPAAEWTYGWQSGAYVANVTGSTIPLIVDQALVIYFSTSYGVGSLRQATGEVFDPTDPTTYVYNIEALALPDDDKANCFTLISSQLLIGGIKNVIYPWDRVSPSYQYPILCPETVVYKMVSIGQSTYIFSGNKGRIYITSGSSVQDYKSVTDYISGIYNPYIIWDDANYTTNQLVFSFRAFQNGNGTRLDTVAGVWAIDTTTDGMRMINKISASGYGGIVRMVAPCIGNTFMPLGNGIYAGWTQSTTYGVDAGSSSPYDNYETYVDTDIIPIGTYLEPLTPAQIEWKLAAPMVSGEGIRIYYRKNITDTFTLIGTDTTTRGVGSYFESNFEKAQWVQFRIETKSTSSSPSYMRLTELRIRNLAVKK